MRSFILLFFLCLPFCWLVGQNEGLEKRILIKKDSVSFYSFNKKGVTEYTILPSKKLTETFTKYSNPFPVELKNTTLEALSYVVSKSGTVYFLYPGGGLLFKYIDGVFERIDESFAFRNQFSGYFFELNNELYLLGGYGYWQSNSLLTRFSFETRSWELVPTTGQGPSFGVNAGSFVLDNNTLYVFDFYHRINDTSEKNNSLFTLDLDKMVWVKKGNLNSVFYNDIERKNFEIIIPFKNSLFQKSINDSQLRIISPANNQLSFYNASDLHNINSLAVIVGGNIVYPVLSADREYETLTVKSLYENIVLQNEEVLTNDFVLLKDYFIYVAGFSFLLIFLTFIKFNKEGIFFFVDENGLNGLNNTLLINKDERFLLELISKNKKIDNSDVLNYFKDSKISLDASVKRKNKVIDDLNRKALEAFQVVLILKQSSKSDSRQVVYYLNSEIEM
jgi:hypothetical protein